MLRFVDEITNKPEWWTKVRNPVIANKWKAEALSLDWRAYHKWAKFTEAMADAVKSRPCSREARPPLTNAADAMCSASSSSDTRPTSLRRLASSPSTTTLALSSSLTPSSPSPSGTSSKTAPRRWRMCRTRTRTGIRAATAKSSTSFTRPSGPWSTAIPAS